MVAVGEPNATLVSSFRTRASRLGGAARLRSAGTWDVGGRQQILGSAALDAISKQLRGEGQPDQNHKYIPSGAPGSRLLID